MAGGKIKMAEMPQREQSSLEKAIETARGPANADNTLDSAPDQEPNDSSCAALDDAMSHDHLQAGETYTTEKVEPLEILHTPEDDAQLDEESEPKNEYSVEDSSQDAGPDDDLDENGALRISFANKRVLLVEDDADTVEILTQHLKDMGVAEVMLEQNAGGALNQLLTDREMFPHIVVLELALIGMDGIQFLAQLRAHKSRRMQDLPAVVITMLDSPSIYRRAARQKVGAFLRKPVSAQGLRKGLEAALRGEIVEQPFSQPKSWLDDVDEQELRAKREAIKAEASAKVREMGLLARVLDAIIPWSGKA
ncbi:MAG: response regulator [Alphaproteobacteria bacterium]|nr:response regulator [Alphaproteobacteria bacterium]